MAVQVAVFINRKKYTVKTKCEIAEKNAVSKCQPQAWVMFQKLLKSIWEHKAEKLKGFLHISKWKIN